MNLILKINDKVLLYLEQCQQHRTNKSAN